MCPAQIPLAQITTPAGQLQAKNRPITIVDALHDLGLARSAPEAEKAAFSAVRGLYVHIPFCFHKCHYCDFYSIVDSQDRQSAFADRLVTELEAAAVFVEQSVETIFVGGGTPTLLKPHLWQRLLEAIHRWTPLANGGEFTVEANPETVTPELAEVLAEGGVNRVSIGCQSFNPKHLTTLERWHEPRNVERSVDILRAAGIVNLNLDLIYAVPGQTLVEWQADLDAALALQPSHLSCYGLMYEPNTPLTVRVRQGQIQPAEQDLEAAMYEATIERLAAAGFEHYEISNWARLDDSHSSSRAAAGASSNRCRHNMLYWSNANWWPLGPSASGHIDGVRWKNVPRLGEYLEYGPLPPILDVERVDEDTRIGERFMLGLRMIEGLLHDEVDWLLERGSRAAERRAAIQCHINTGLLERTETSLRLSRSGLMLADSVLADLI